MKSARRGAEWQGWGGLTRTISARVSFNLWTLATEKAVEWWRVHEPTRRLAWQKAEKAIAMVAMQALVEIETNQAVILPLLALHVADTNTAGGNSAIGAAYGLGRLGDAGVPMLP